MEQSTLSRGAFLKQLGLSTQALAAFYCLGTLTACTADETEVTPDPADPTSPVNTGLTGVTTGDSLNFTMNLKIAAYAKLLTPGSFVIVGDALVANANGTYVGLSRRCTHQGTQLAFRPAEGDLWCDNHGSEFNLNGTVKKSPAAASLKMYTTSFDAANETLTVKA